MIRIFRHYVPYRKLLLIGIESLLIFGALFIFLNLPKLGDPTWLNSSRMWWAALAAVVITATCQLTMYYNDLYDWKIYSARDEFRIRLVEALGYSFIVLALLMYLFERLFEKLDLSVTRFIATVVLLFIILTAWRAFYKWIVVQGRFEERILLIGHGGLATKIRDVIQERRDTGLRIHGFIQKDGTEADATGEVVGGFEDIVDIARQQGISRVVVALTDRRGNLPVHELLACKMMGVKIEEGESLFERLTGKIAVERLRPSYLIFSDGFRKTRLTLAAKRAGDIFFAVLGLILALPIIAVAVPLIKLDSPGPVFFRQKRVGQDGHIFTLLKFRSMREDAERKTGPIWATEGDTRITRIGKFIRKTRIDEIPQMLNVLKGDMSFVGPRPERPFFVEELKYEIPYYTERLTVKPGITGWAQINYPYGSSKQDALEKLQYDLFYIKNMSSFFDLFIMFSTIKVVLMRRGAV
ncbi:MAG: TIGR03013 family PEP-CTERM/XrtA system glycosyltransferase [Planctomycetota bacterium]